MVGIIYPKYHSSSSEGFFIRAFCCLAGELFADSGKCVQQLWSMGVGEIKVGRAGGEGFEMIPPTADVAALHIDY